MDFVREKRKQISSHERLPMGKGKEKGKPGKNEELRDKREQLVQCIHPRKCFVSGPSGINFRVIVSSLCVGDRQEVTHLNSCL